MMLLWFRCSSLQRMHVAITSGKGRVDPFSPGTPPGPTVFMAMCEAAAAARGLTSLTFFMPGGLRPLAPGAPNRRPRRQPVFWRLVSRSSTVSGIRGGPTAVQICQTTTGRLRSRRPCHPMAAKVRKPVPKAGSWRTPLPAAEAIRKTLKSERMPAAMPRRHCPPACSRDVAWRVRP